MSKRYKGTSSMADYPEASTLETLVDAPITASSGDTLSDHSWIEALPYPTLLLNRNLQLIAANEKWSHYTGHQLEHPAWQKYLFKPEALLQLIPTATATHDIDITVYHTSTDSFRRNRVKVALQQTLRNLVLLTFCDIEDLAKKLTEHEEIEDRLRFLNEASELMARSLDYSTTLANVTKLAVPKLGDQCVIDLLKDDGNIQRLAVSATSPEKETVLWELATEYGKIGSFAHGYGQVSRTGKPDYIEITDEVLQTFASNPDHLALLQSLELKRCVFLPLVARGKHLGVITFAMSESNRPYDHHTLALAEEIAHRTSIAVDNSLLYASAQIQIAERNAAEDLSFTLATQIEKERSRLRTLVSNVPGVVWEAYGEPDQSNQQINFVSDYVESFLGYSTEEWLSTTNFWLTIVHPEDCERAAEEAHAIFAGKRGGVSEFRWLHKDGTPIWVEARSSVILDGNGDPIGMRGVTMDITERRALEEDLQQSESLLRLIISNIPALVAYIGKDLRYRFNNSHYKEWYNLSDYTQLAGTAVIDLVGKEAWNSFKDYVYEALSGKEVHFECNIPFNSGERFVSATYVPHFNESGEVEGIITLVQDITHQKQADEERKLLREAVESSDKQVRLIANVVPALISYVDAKGTYQYVNQGYEEMFGYTSSEIVGKHIKEIIGATKYAEMQPHVERALQGNQVHIETTLANKNNVLRYVSVILTPDVAPDNSIRGFVTLVRDISEERVKEEILRRSEAQWRRLVESNPIGVVLEDFEGHILEANLVYLTMLGYTRQDLEEGRLRWDTITPKQYKTRDVLAIEEVRQSGKFTTYEKEYIRKDGSAITVLIGGALLEGTTDQVVSFVLDITERKQIENSVRESEALLRAMFDQVSVGIGRLDLDGRWIRVNEKLCQITGYTNEELTQRSFQDITPPEDIEEDLRLVQQLLNGTLQTYTLEKRYIRKDGSLVWVKITPSLLRDQEGKPTSFIVVVEDIDERKRAEQGKLESEARFLAVADNAPVLVWLSNINGERIFFNRVWLEFTGRTIEQDCNDGWIENLYPEDRDHYLTSYRNAHISRKEFREEYRLRHHSGTYRWILATGVPRFDEQGNFIGMIGSCIDIQERKAAEVELQRAKETAESASKAKDHFLAVLSHELRTPLTPVLTTVETLEYDERLPYDIKPFIATIRRNIELEARLIDDLLDLTRITRGKLELQVRTVDLHSAISNVLEICRKEINEKRLELSLALHASRFYVDGDSARLQQVLWNLVHNAVKFTPTGGMLRIKTINDEKDNILISIVDNGIGIEGKMLPLIFNPFEQGENTITRQFGGLGLGLAISKNLVEMHHGTLTATSKGKNEGSTFMITLKTVIPSARNSTISLPQPKSRQINQRKKILLVDDHADTGNALKVLLERRGYEVITANTMNSAFELAITGHFHLLISDIGLPDGTGHELMEKLQTAEKPLRAIALSGFGTDQDIERSKQAGFLRHLTKPFSFPQLEQVIEEALAS